MSVVFQRHIPFLHVAAAIISKENVADPFLKRKPVFLNLGHGWDDVLNFLLFVVLPDVGVTGRFLHATC